ncbi:hypothetical protein PGT21_008390 [Puccinia graminis f. sp. tritici]|uniref:Uncharacterized protein n=1 Tax=Puccinia graminis f. sp. tritici TaxID=56615 RepID=A0A5B0NVE3_PUCGR|nr:hypothetical protein PGT21_008390 [Puccinia graminis f. sp. tritici]
MEAAWSPLSLIQAQEIGWHMVIQYVSDKEDARRVHPAGASVKPESAGLLHEPGAERRISGGGVQTSTRSCTDPTFTAFRYDADFQPAAVGANRRRIHPCPLRSLVTDAVIAPNSAGYHPAYSTACIRLWLIDRFVQFA